MTRNAESVVNRMCRRERATGLQQRRKHYQSDKPRRARKRPAPRRPHNARALRRLFVGLELWDVFGDGSRHKQLRIEDYGLRI